MRLVLRRAIGGVRPYFTRGVRPVEQGRQFGVVVTGRLGGGSDLDRPVPAVDPRMVQ